jgi:hypothetical protein
MALRIMDDTMTLEIDNCVVATARCGKHARGRLMSTWIILVGPERQFAEREVPCWS